MKSFVTPFSQFFYVKSVSTKNGTQSAGNKVTPPTTKGEASVAVTADGKQAYIMVNTGKNDIRRSQFIGTASPVELSLKPADQDVRKLRSVKFAISNKVNGGNPIAGQDYHIRLSYNDTNITDNATLQYGNVDQVSVTAYGGMTKGELYKEFAKNLFLSRQAQGRHYYDIFVENTEVTSLKQLAGIQESTVNSVTIKPKPQDEYYLRGTNWSHDVFLTIDSYAIDSQSERMPWINYVYSGDTTNFDGTTTLTAPDFVSIKNGMYLADIEYLYTGNHAYNGINYAPYGFGVQDYEIDPSGEYDVVVISFFPTAYDTTHDNVKNQIIVACDKGKGTELHEKLKDAFGI